VEGKRESPKKAFNDLLQALAELPSDAKKTVLIQTHDYPDLDAVAAAWGLSELLCHYGYTSKIIYRGRIRSISLLAMVRELAIPMTRIHDAMEDLEAEAPLICVDGDPANTNFQHFGGKLLAVIDHHPSETASSCAFYDVRNWYGSCATIVADYWHEQGLPLTRNCATALLMGIQMDTDFLGRRVSPEDLAALNRLFFDADWEFGTRIIKSALSVEDLPAILAAVENGRICGKLYYTNIRMDCSSELISIMADFFLRLKEIDVSVIVESGGGFYHVSVRSRPGTVCAGDFVRIALDGLGKAGGHAHMAGGIIKASDYPGDESLFKRFARAYDCID
jgi:nanoRNase/pAp phosphatase (c-di-AMP/oligoRNAs hydrolase)